MWGKNVGQPSGTLPNDNTGVTICAAQYDLWRSKFGNTSGSGAGASVAVPELGTVVLLIFASVAANCRRYRVA
jgi:hypothetical protein